MATYEIPTANGYRTVQAKTKAEAVSSVSDAVLNKPRNVKGVNFVTPNNVPTQAFESSNTVNIKQPSISTSAQGMSSQIESLAQSNQDTFTRNLEERSKQLEADRTTSKDMYLQSLLGSQGENQLTQEAYAKTVDPLEQELTDINNQIMAEQNAVRRRLQELDKNTQGLFGGALQDEKNRVERESLAKQADLSVIQMARQGKYDSAKEIADRAIQVRLEQQKTINDALKFNYDENKELFTKAEQRAFETAQGDRERKLNKEEADLKEISDLSLDALREGAPASIVTRMRNAKTPAEAIALGGKYIGALDRQLKSLQVQKLKSELDTNPDAGDLVKINGKDYIRYKDGTISDPILPEASDTNAVVSRLDNKLKTLDKLLKPSVGLATSAGSLRGAPIPFLAKNQINNWRADAVNVIQKLTVDELGRVKSDGVTFGQLSNGERQAVGDAATALGAASIRDKDGNPTGKFRMSEKKVLQEFQKIYDGYALDFQRRAGVPYQQYLQNPEIIKTKLADDFIEQASPTLINSTIYGGYQTN